MDASKASGRRDQFKSTFTAKEKQSERRTQFLEAQKQRRLDWTRHVRNIVQQCQTDDEAAFSSEEENRITTKKDEIKDPKPLEKKKRANSKKSTRWGSISDQIMKSEVMREVPSDLQSQWLAVLCPTGTRSLVLSTKNKTTAFTFAGTQKASFLSYLPGGNTAAEVTLLDCILDESKRVFYVLDILCWNGHPFYECDVEFRCFWLHTKFSEVHSSLNKTFAYHFDYTFQPLEYVECTFQTISHYFQQCMDEQNSNGVDGVLFFHKQGHYVIGPDASPLVCWISKKTKETALEILNILQSGMEL